METVKNINTLKSEKNKIIESMIEQFNILDSVRSCLLHNVEYDCIDFVQEVRIDKLYDRLIREKADIRKELNDKGIKDIKREINPDKVDGKGYAELINVPGIKHYGNVPEICNLIKEEIIASNKKIIEGEKGYSPAFRNQFHNQVASRSSHNNSLDSSSISENE